MNIAAPDLFACLSHETRLRCLMLLREHEELCVCEFTHALGASQPYVSRHLGQLRKVGLVVDRKDGLWIHYRIHPELTDWIREILESMAAALAGEDPYVGDSEALAMMENRPGAISCT